MNESEGGRGGVNDKEVMCGVNDKELICEGKWEVKCEVYRELDGRSTFRDILFW